MLNWNLKIRYRLNKAWKMNLAILLLPSIITAQQNEKDTLLQQATLENCIRYAIVHNPDLKNARLNEDITEATIKSKLADWFPQLNFNYSLQHNFQLPTLNFNGNIIHSGSDNTSGLEFGATQNIFNRDVLLASRTSKDVRLQAKQNTREQNINIAVSVSKAFYDLILTRQQISVTEQDIQRIEISLKDAYYQYQSGISDKTDYKRATISLNNAKAQKKFGDETVNAKYTYLKELIGVEAAIRISLFIYNNKEDIDKLIYCLKKLEKHPKLVVDFLNL